MPQVRPNKATRYSNQRPKVAQPVIPLAVVRKALGLTLQTVCDRIEEEHGIKTDRGTISAIELGHRGASARMLVAIADALGISADSIDTQYEPRRGRSDIAQVPA